MISPARQHDGQVVRARLRAAAARRRRRSRPRARRGTPPSCRGPRRPRSASARFGSCCSRVELLVPGRARRRVDAPGGAVRDHDRVEAPLVELREQLGGRGAPTRGSRRGSSRTGTPVGHGCGTSDVSRMKRARSRPPSSRTESANRPRAAARAAAAAPRRRPRRAARPDRPRRDLVVVEVAQDHVLVAVVVRGRRADLRPLPAEERRRCRGSPRRRATALHWRIASIVSLQRRGVSVSS